MENLDVVKFDPPEQVKDYSFKDWNNNSVALSELFKDKEDLIVVHNMGTSCPYCTMWADGYNGVLQHLEDRTAFAMVSNDDIATQKEFAQKRGWKFNMLSAKDTDFFKDMGFTSNDGGPEPGVSAFLKKDNEIKRISKAPFGPGDKFCVTFSFFELLAKGTNGWQAQFEY